MIGFYADRFGIAVDDVMIRNVLETDTAEASDLLTAGFILHFTVLGIFPLIAIWRIDYRPQARLRELRYKGQIVVGALLVSLLCMFSFSNQYTDFFRQHRSLRYYTNPSYALYSGVKLMRAAQASPAGEVNQVMPDAAIDAEDHGHELIILVVGEAVRRDRFSLNGYARQTNPYLEREANILSYTGISSCGTSTAISVPCMFSFAGRKEFDRDEQDTSENVLDVLSRAGVSVLWRDNNSSSKGVADRIALEDFRSPDVNPECDIECRDVGMLHGLQTYIEAQSGDILIVLHQMGNHGPAYYKRYPEEFRKFVPECLSEELSDCTNEQIGNSYDNAILYTDYFLAQVIALLKANTPRFETAMLYIGDHGESLGENGLYLHGMPYALAPDEQTAVPMIVWAGESSDVDMLDSLGLRDTINSHDALSYSLLAMFEIDGATGSQEQPLLLAFKDETD